MIIHLRIRRVISYMSNAVDSTTIVQNFINTSSCRNIYSHEGWHIIKPFWYSKMYGSDAFMYICVYFTCMCYEGKWQTCHSERPSQVEEWANKSIMKFSEDKCKVLHLGREKRWQQYRLGCLAGMHLSREQHEPAATPGPAWWPMWHSPTGLVTRFIDSSRHSKEWIGAQHSQGSSQEQKELEAGTRLDISTAAVWLTARDSAEMGSWAGALGGGPRGGWAGQLSSWCAQGVDTPVLTIPGYAGGHEVDRGQLCVLTAKAVWVEQCPVERVIPPCSVLIQPHLDIAYSFGPLIQGRSCKTRIHWRPSSWPGLEYLPCEGGWGYWACASCILRKRQLQQGLTAAPWYQLRGYQEDLWCVVEG